MTAVEQTVKLTTTTNPTLDQIQEFLDKAKELGIPGKTKTQEIGTSSGYHFAGTYSFTPKGIKATAKVDA